MKSENSDLDISKGTDEIYSSCNMAIRWLGNRLIQTVQTLISKLEGDALPCLA